MVIHSFVFTLTSSSSFCFFSFIIEEFVIRQFLVTIHLCSFQQGFGHKLFARRALISILHTHRSHAVIHMNLYQSLLFIINRFICDRVQIKVFKSICLCVFIHLILLDKLTLFSNLQIFDYLQQLGSNSDSNFKIQILSNLLQQIFPCSTYITRT